MSVCECAFVHLFVCVCTFLLVYLPRKDKLHSEESNMNGPTCVASLALILIIFLFGLEVV